MPEKLLNIKQVAEVFGVTPRTIQNWLVEEDEEKRLTGIKVGSRWLFQQSDIDDFLERQRRRSQHPKGSDLVVAV